MWNYEKRLQYPVKITKTNPKNITIRWSRWRVGCIYEIFVSKIHDAV